jgi:pimeloyl-ACP methyl ester carboxylesterase
MPYVEAGEGELLLFVHGSLCDYRYWQPQLAGLSKQYRCVAKKSPDMFRRTATALQSWLADARRETVRGASHGMNLAHPAAFNRYIDEFIRATSAD